MNAVGIVTWIQELIWRDFYRNVLVGFPRVCMGKPFKLETMNIQWLFEDDVFQSWCYGKTGYPIVDAGVSIFHCSAFLARQCLTV
jgi:deoxyribodipyrimidine photo-lyase